MVVYSPGDKVIPHGGGTPWSGSHRPGTPGVDVEIPVPQGDVPGPLNHDYYYHQGPHGSATSGNIGNWVN